MVVIEDTKIDKVVGVCSLQIDQEEGIIDDLIIRKDYIAREAGDILLNAIMKLAWYFECDRCVLSSGNYKSGISFVAEHGFELENINDQSGYEQVDQSFLIKYNPNGGK